MRPPSFTEALWKRITPVYAAILDHPFIRELTEGTLSPERFLFYMQQDSLYLRDFSRALAIAGARAGRGEDREAFLGFAAGAVAVERALHETYFVEFGATPAAEQSPACLAYTSFLTATAATAPYSEAVAALLPCFWIYREVGNDIVRRSAGGIEANPYRRWIATYAGEEFSASVDRAISITESAAREASQAEQLRMQRAFEIAARLEWNFWDSAYRLERWQPPTYTSMPAYRKP